MDRGIVATLEVSYSGWSLSWQVCGGWVQKHSDYVCNYILHSYFYSNSVFTINVPKYCCKRAVIYNALTRAWTKQYIFWKWAMEITGENEINSDAWSLAEALALENVTLAKKSSMQDLCVAVLTAALFN